MPLNCMRTNKPQKNKLVA
uniref:Uncharacterized protein n=1 Tax=Anguilla anguilla TaxID=7936 RepID=A0A0E9PT62_ANGAN